MRQIKIWPIALITCFIPVSAIAIPPTQLNSTTLVQADRSPSQFNLSGQWILRTQDFSANDNGTACNATPNREFIKEPIITQNGNELDVDRMTLIITDSSISGNSVYLKGEIFSVNETVSNDGNLITGTLTCIKLTQPFKMTLDCLQMERLWFPIVQEILNEKFKNHKSLKVAIERTQWRDKNVFVISLIWDKRGLPLYWQLLNKRGSSNIAEQQALISPVLELLKDYEIIILGDREFGSVKLASWLCEQQVKFVLRIKQERYIQSEEADCVRLSELGLLPGSSFYVAGVKVTKQKGFGSFDVVGYWRRKYRGKVDDEGWYLLTNLGGLKPALAAFKCRSGIEAMFKDCKTGGYNLEKSHANNERLKT